MMAEQLREIDRPPSAIILEPVGKNTAPAVALAAPGNSVVGVLTQQVWDVAGPSDAADVSSFLIQPFIN